MGQHWLLVCAVVAVALATDVAQEFVEHAHRRLSKVGVVFLEDDDAVNIQCCLCAIQPVSRVILRSFSRTFVNLDAIEPTLSTQVHRRDT